MAYTVKKVAELAGVSVRTLHHYDQIGLLEPAAKSPSGYRLYSDAELERLQQILIYRELEIDLNTIKRILDNPAFDRRRALLEQREALLRRGRRIERLVSLIDRTLASMERGTKMGDDELFQGFEHEAYLEEARRMYDPELVEEAVERTSKFTRSDWETVMKENRAISEAIAGLMGKGPGDPAVQERIAEWHRFINERFYTCTLDVFRGLGDLYVEDARFADHYDQIRPGLARFMREAMHVYCERAERG